MYTKYTLYTGGVYFAIPRLSDYFLGIRGWKLNGSKAELIAKAYNNGPVISSLKTPHNITGTHV
jgi:hypothetical protein